MSVRRNVKRWLSILKRRFIRPVLPQNADGKVLLHIGCGPIMSPEFINVDAIPYAHVHIVTDDISQLGGFASGTVDLVYMCHILEHFKKPVLKQVLAEMHRILSTAFVLRMRCISSRSWRRCIASSRRTRY